MEWISCKEKQPEDIFGRHRKQIQCIVFSRAGKVGVASRVRNVAWNSEKQCYEETADFTWNKYRKVTHWMPLPEPPGKAKKGAKK